MRRGMFQRGITLIELLAATMILSAMAAAVSSVHRDATAAARRAALTRDAIEIADRWTRLSIDAREHWAWQDEQGRAWTVRTEPMQATLSSETDQLDAAEWERVVVEVTPEDGVRPTTVLRLRRPAAPAGVEAGQP